MRTLLPEVLNCNDVASLLHISLMTVSRLCKNKKLPHKRIGRQIRFSRRELAKLYPEFVPQYSTKSPGRPRLDEAGPTAAV